MGFSKRCFEVLSSMSMRHLSVIVRISYGNLHFKCHSIVANRFWYSDTEKYVTKRSLAPGLESVSGAVVLERRSSNSMRLSFWPGVMKVAVLSLACHRVPPAIRGRLVDGIHVRLRLHSISRGRDSVRYVE